MYNSIYSTLYMESTFYNSRPTSIDDEQHENDRDTEL
jgi:hypothetical protein